MAWSMTPWRPPKMLVSIAGQASFHTAPRSGPSMIERSKRRPTPTTSPVTCSTGSAKHVLTSPACRHNEPPHQRGHPAVQRRALRLKEGRDEEWMVLELHRPHVPAVIPPGSTESARFEPLGVARIEAVIAVVAFD